MCITSSFTKKGVLYSAGKVLQAIDSEDMMERNEESATKRIVFQNSFLAYRQKKAWIREKLNDGYTRSPFALSKAIDCRADRRII